MVRRAFRTAKDRRKRRIISAQEAATRMQQINNAKEFLFQECNRSAFREQVQQIALQALQPLAQRRHPHVQRHIAEQRYDILDKILLDLESVDAQLAERMHLPIAAMKHGISDLLAQDVLQTGASAETNWERGLLKELHEDLNKLTLMKQCLVAHPDVLPDSCIQEVRLKVDAQIRQLGLDAQARLQASSLSDALKGIFEFGLCLVKLAHIFTHLMDFKIQAENQVTAALTACQEKHWGANFLFELGMKLSQGKIGDAKKDATVAKILMNEFSHFKDVQTVTWLSSGLLIWLSGL